MHWLCQFAGRKDGLGARLLRVLFCFQTGTISQMGSYICTTVPHSELSLELSTVNSSFVWLRQGFRRNVFLGKLGPWLPQANDGDTQDQRRGRLASNYGAGLGGSGPPDTPRPGNRLCVSWQVEGEERGRVSAIGWTSPMLER